MTPEFIQQRKEALLEKKKDLEEQLASFAEKKSDENWETKYPQMVDDLEGSTDEVEEYDNLLGVEYTLEEDLKAINAALEKIETGEYGKCEHCKQEIDEARLIALPEARTCEHCK
jgi:RNA polymerase-binding transcription factor DksA